MKPHHRVWLEHHGMLPDWKSRREVIHHKNGDHSDNSIENLELMTQAEHMRLHEKELGNMAHRPGVREKKSLSMCGNKNSLGAFRSEQTLERLSVSLKGKGLGNRNASGQRSPQAIENIKAGVARARLAKQEQNNAR